jgi:histidinol-phosphate phosphatase family protein
MNNFICLDRDGTIIKHIHHLTNLELVEIIPGVIDACKILATLDFHFGVFTNQSVIGRGKCTLDDVNKINEFIQSEFRKKGIEIEFFFVCPHVPQDLCNCRKPLTAMGLAAIEKYGIDPSLSYMIGDNVTDVDFGNNLGMKTVFISDNDYSNATISCGDLYTAAQLIAKYERPT